MRYLLMIGFVLIVSTLSFRAPVAFTVTGKVLDASGSPIQHVSIVVKGTNEHAVTAADGSFTITIQSDKATLVFSFVGYDMKEVKISKDKNKPLEIKMQLSTQHLSEVVVIDHGAAKKRSFRNQTNEKSIAPGYIQPFPDRAEERRIRRNGGFDNDFNREGYDAIVENRFLTVTDNPLSTFSIDVDAASYSNIRRMLNNGQMPVAGAVRIEEMINYFKYDYPQPNGNDPFSINTEISACPWNEQHKLVLVGLQGKKVPTENLPASNLVFLIDVSGSMMDENKLPLVQRSMKLLVDQLREEDKVAIVVYAGNAGLVLPSTSGEEKITIKDAIDRLRAGGSTAGGAGIKLAYKVARDNFLKNGNNRVILCTDGDFNVGPSSDAALEDMIEQERESGVFLTVLGFGMGNYQDAKMQKLADKGNGNHGYIDNFNEARKMLVSEFGGTLFTIAKDVKLQIEFNPAKVQAYRLIGYENRILNKEDFNNDKKDAGDLGSGHTVTALYEIIPVGVKSKFIEKVDKLKYQKSNKQTSVAATNEIMNIKFRYKQPDANKSKLIEHPLMDYAKTISEASENFRFAAAVAQFGMLLRNSEFKQGSSYGNAWQLAKEALGTDKEGYRVELLKLIRNAETLTAQTGNNRKETLSKR